MKIKIIIIFCLLFQSCINYKWIDNDFNYDRIIWYYPDNKKNVYSEYNMDIIFALDFYAVSEFYRPLDTNRFYVIIGDSISKIDSIRIKPNRIYVKIVDNNKYKCYRYYDGGAYQTQYIEVLFYNEKVKKIGVYKSKL